MTNLYIYYLELRNRIILVSLTWVTTILISYIYKETILFLVIEPVINCSNSTKTYFILTDITEIVSVYFKVIIFLGNHSLILFGLYHIILFFHLGLYHKEYQRITSVVKLIFLFFGASFFFFNKIVLPISWQFFLSFQSFSMLKSIDFYFESKLNEYVDFYTTSYYLCLYYFQIFTVLGIFLEYVKNDITKLKQFRKILYWCFVAIATFITPPDITSQLVLSLTAVFIYEFLLWGLIFQISRQKLNTG